jgi:3-hydroxyacyl-[acyl-carrier-protein] dehydratase
MPVPAPHYDPAKIDFSEQVADLEAIRKLLPQRPPFEMLTAVVKILQEEKLIIGYKDVTMNEFWVPGHMPGNPLMPGVLMCEAAAQLASYYSLASDLHRGLLMGLGGIEHTRFRRAVRPGDRLVLIAKTLKIRRRITFFNVQGFVGTEMAFHTDVIGAAIGTTEELES